MRFYVTLLRGPGASEKEQLEVPDCNESWSCVVPDIDELHIFTIQEHRARRLGRSMGKDPSELKDSPDL
jgi:hypothetical protein